MIVTIPTQWWCRAFLFGSTPFLPCLPSSVSFVGSFCVLPVSLPPGPAQYDIMAFPAHNILNVVLSLLALYYSVCVWHYNFHMQNLPPHNTYLPYSIIALLCCILPTIIPMLLACSLCVVCSHLPIFLCAFLFPHISFLFSITTARF